MVLSDLSESGGLVAGAEPEQGLEACERGAATVVPEDELVEVDGQVFRRDDVVGALQPRFSQPPGRVERRPRTATVTPPLDAGCAANGDRALPSQMKGGFPGEP